MIGDTLLHDAERALARTVGARGDEPLVHQGLIAWVLEEPAPPVVAAVVEGGDALRSYTEVAVASLWRLPEDRRLGEGLAWLSATSPNRGDHLAPVCLDAAAQLALALPPHGASLSGWLERVHRAGAGSSEPSWLRGAVNRLLGGTGAVPSDMLVALAGRGVWESTEAAEATVLAELQSGAVPDEPLRAAFYLAALRWIRRSAATALPGRASPADVLTLLQGVGPGLAEWTWEERGRKQGAAPVTWEVTSEYHVQNLLWLALRPVFPDLKKEEYVPSRGHHQPRTDLLIPSLRLVIEVKYLDKTGRAAWRDRTEELKADVTGYLAPGSPADLMIVFLWDDTASTEQHETFRQGFEGIQGVVGVVVVARPGRMPRRARRLEPRAHEEAP